jgi:hypothetical protein
MRLITKCEKLSISDDEVVKKEKYS